MLVLPVVSVICKREGQFEPTLVGVREEERGGEHVHPLAISYRWVMPSRRVSGCMISGLAYSPGIRDEHSSQLCNAGSIPTYTPVSFVQAWVVGVHTKENVPGECPRDVFLDIRLDGTLLVGVVLQYLGVFAGHEQIFSPRALCTLAAISSSSSTRKEEEVVAGTHQPKCHSCMPRGYPL